MPPPSCLEVWSPLPPKASGIADYVDEQLATLGREFQLALVVENPDEISSSIKTRYRVIAATDADAACLRVYHVGNSPLHGFIYREAIRTPGVVFLHEWNLHELLLGFAVRAGDFTSYRATMRREHGGRGSVAADTIASALGGRHWSALFPLNLELLERSLAVVSLAGSTAAKVAARTPGTPALHLPHHAVLHSHTTDRVEALERLGLSGKRVVLAPGLGTASKELAVVQAAVDSLRRHRPNLVLVTVGGGSGAALAGSNHDLGRVDLETLGDAIVAAEVVVALRFPTRGEASGVVMRTLAAGRALIVSSGSTADEDLPAGVVARLSPGPGEIADLTALIGWLLDDAAARLRLETLALYVASTQKPEALTPRLVDFLRTVEGEREALERRLRERTPDTTTVRAEVRGEVEAAAASLGLAHLPPNVFERLAGL